MSCFFVQKYIWYSRLCAVEMRFVGKQKLASAPALNSPAALAKGEYIIPFTTNVKCSYSLKCDAFWPRSDITQITSASGQVYAL
jgi:hypothetical protein